MILLSIRRGVYIYVYDSTEYLRESEREKEKEKIGNLGLYIIKITV